MLSKFRQTIIQAAGRQPDDPDTRKAKTGGWKLAKVFGKAGSPAGTVFSDGQLAGEADIGGEGFHVFF